MNKTRDKIIRSPFFYVGDKYKLMSQINALLPNKINTYIEPFAGGGSSFLNVDANKYLINDIDHNIINLHLYLSSFANNSKKLLKLLFQKIDQYKLSCSYRGINVPLELKKQYPKTYFSHFNKKSYEKMRTDFNKHKDILTLYLLLIYGFNHMIRFNSCGKFNLPVGNVDFNKNVHNALLQYIFFMEKKDIKFFNKNYSDFLDNITIDNDSYIYFDPPYLISHSEYNKLWNIKEEKKLYNYLDKLNSNHIKFGITNLAIHKGIKNEIFLNWAKSYICHDLTSNYISFNNNSIKKDSKEIFVTNYDRM